jgi:hypothetical protein
MKSRPPAYYIEHVDELLGHVDQIFGISTGPSADLKALDVTAQRYRTDKQAADEVRRMRSFVGQQTAEPVPDIDTLLEEAVSKERAAREAFAKAFQEYEDKYRKVER